LLSKVDEEIESFLQAPSAMSFQGGSTADLFQDTSNIRFDPPSDLDTEAEETNSE
jgi:hypothetical protein